VRTRRSWRAPEVVQTSAMDCGPAALKCLLEGHGLAASYGRLREVCQTSIDGTSIDTIETVAQQLGLEVEQRLIPIDHIALPEAQSLPALVVVRHAESATHFVVIWRRFGRWLQIMDPAVGRRWVPERQFREEIFRHVASVQAPQWRTWAGSAECIVPLQARMRDLGLSETLQLGLVKEALDDPGWFAIGALDAAVRLAQSLVAAGGLTRGTEAGDVTAALFRTTRDSGHDIHTLIPPAYWSAAPDVSNQDPTREMLLIKGGVLLHVAGVLGDEAARTSGRTALPPELQAVTAETQVSPLVTMWRLLRADGLLAPMALVIALAIATLTATLETLLLRGMLDMASSLPLTSQRVAAGLALVALVGILMAFELAGGFEVLRQGRQLEMRLRMALLSKLPRLNDRYFQSRPVTDMADRSHNIHLVRTLPALGSQLLQSLFELGLTTAGIVVLSPASLPAALALLAVSILLPLLLQPLLNERDLRVRSHAGALHGFYLDALLGLVAIRAHRAEGNVQRQHESLLTDWAKAVRRSVLLGLGSEALLAFATTGLAGALLLRHFVTAGGVAGSDLLLIFWVLKVPATGGRIAGLAQQYPALRNVLMRLLEPLGAPDDPIASTAVGAAAGQSEAAAPGVALRIEKATVLAAGHTILRDIDVSIGAGEHIAIVGKSGAGKSSLIGLLLGWHHLAAGRIIADGQVFDGGAVEGLRGIAAWVDPGIQIWNTSLRDNLEYASRTVGGDSLDAAIETARLGAVVRNLPEGLASLLGEGGGLVSGGEGQRVRLARAMLKSGTRLALLDEPFRGLDRDQRRDLLSACRRWWRGTTLICVTHDVAETLSFDRVLVVEDGRIVEDGKPRELSQSATRYRDLLQSETQVQRTLWQGQVWRRMTLADGRIREDAGAP